MPIELSRSGVDWTLRIEGVILLICAPFLLFPTLSVVVTVIALLAFGILWLVPLFFKRWPWPFATPFDLLLIFFGLFLITSILVSADLILTLPKATGVILGLAVWRFMARLAPTNKMLYLWFVLYGLLGAGLIFLGTISVNWMDKVPAIADIVSKLPDGFILLPETPTSGVHSNQLAGTLLLYIPFVLSVLIGFYWSRPSKGIVLVFIFLALCLLVLLLLTQSRSGWLACAASIWGLLLLWWISLPKADRVRKIFVALMGILLILGGSFIARLGTSRLMAIWEDPGQQSLVGDLNTIGFRQEVWRWALVATQDFPFTGTGLGTFRVVVRRFYPLNVAPSYDIAHAHNIFLQMALDIGLPGLVVYLAFIGLIFYVGLWAAKRDARLRPLLIGILGSLAAMHLFGLTDALALGSKPHLIFWIMAGLISTSYRLIWLRKSHGQDVSLIA